MLLGATVHSLQEVYHSCSLAIPAQRCYCSNPGCATTAAAVAVAAVVAAHLPGFICLREQLLVVFDSSQFVQR